MITCVVDSTVALDWRIMLGSEVMCQLKDMEGRRLSLCKATEMCAPDFTQGEIIC